MKTWEMIKELTENPDKKFRRVGEDRELYVGVYNNFVAWEGDYALETGGEPFEIYTDLEWEEVKQPVTFMEVLEKVKNDNLTIISLKRKDSRLAYARCTLDFILDDLAMLYESNAIAKFLLEGKWYIED